DSSLELVQAGIHSGNITDVSLSPSIFPQQPDAFCYLRIVCHHCSPITQRAQIFSWVKAKSSNASPGADLKTPQRGPVRLGAGFDNIHIVAASNLHDSRHISRLPVEVNGNNTFKTTSGSWLPTCIMLFYRIL